MTKAQKVQQKAQQKEMAVTPLQSPRTRFSPVHPFVMLSCSFTFFLGSSFAPQRWVVRCTQHATRNPISNIHMHTHAHTYP